MIIEQELMRSINTVRGLTHRRGLTENSFARWVSSMPQCPIISDSIEKFANVLPTFSEQHKELRDSRIDRDNADLKKLVEWFSDHSPFDDNKVKLTALSSGLVAPKEINCHVAYKVGHEVMSRHVGKKFSELKLKRNDRVLPIAYSNKAIKVANTHSVVNPNNLFS